MAGNLARVHWQMGQTLLPEHFTAQEDALLADNILRFRMGGLPAYGIAALEWNQTLISEGVFSIHTLTLVMPSGLLLDVPRNAVTAPFNMNITGSVVVPVYGHVIDSSAADRDGVDEWRAPDDDTLARLVYQLVLSSEQSHADALESFKIAAFEKDPEGVWRLRQDVIPALLQVGRSPFLMAELDAFSEALEIFQYNLALDAASYLSGSGLFRVEQCLKSVYHIQRFLANLRSQIQVHPFYVYEALKNFYVEVCFYKSTAPKQVADPYNHDQLAVNLANILEPLQEQMKMAAVESPYLPFKLADGLYQVKLPSVMREAKEVYLLVQKSHVSETITLEDLKLAGFTRISLVHKMALQGVGLKRVDQPAFQHSFGPEVDFFRIIEGEEWDHALKELSLTFYDRPQFKHMEFYVYRR